MRRSIPTFLAHVSAGVLTALATHISPALAILSFLTFAIYEVDEDWHLRDGAYIDIRQYAYGFFATSALMIIITLLS